MTDSPNTASTPAQVAVLDGSCSLSREEIGGKAWGLNRMRALGLPVPPAIVVTTHACREYHASNRAIGAALWSEIVARLAVIETATARRFGDRQRPLLVSVRSGAAHSMPGMMDTILNLGMNTAVEAALATQMRDAAYAEDTYRRFIEQYTKVVLHGHAGPIPSDPLQQLRAAIAAVFDSWHSARAQVYRQNRGMSDAGGTAVTIQAMVFGNLDARSGTGVVFSRNPITGDPPAWGEWLARGQGEDVVAGAHTPQPLRALQKQMPDVHAELMRAVATLEADARDIQDIEFTVESGELWVLQTRVAKRSPQAAVRAAVAFAEEGLISKAQAVHRLSAEQVRQLPALALVPDAAHRAPLASGEGACPGVASGAVVTSPLEAEQRAARGEAVILARALTSPEDLPGVIAARALITEQGGATSHAAVVSRELGRPCVVGCGADTVTTLAGQLITLDGTTGRIWAGDLTLAQSEEAANPDLRKLIEWATPLVPMRILNLKETTAAVDLDVIGPGWRAALKPDISVRGTMLETDEGIRAALAAGVREAAVRHRLPALLACLEPGRAPENTRTSGVVSELSAARTSELALLRLVGLKGRAGIDILADALGLSLDTVRTACAPLCERGLCATQGEALRLTREGRERLAALLAQERAQTDAAAVAALYGDFWVLNAELKEIMTAWQLRAAGVPNDHLDAAYDHSVLQRLADLHGRTQPWLLRLSRLSPRLAAYDARLNRAASRIAAGDRSYVAKIISDSYHTVWLELHEELITLTGLTRSSARCIER